MTAKKTQKQWMKTLQFFAAYLVAAWTLLQFVDWVLIRYSISPYWVDMMLWFFIGIIPSLLIYLYHQERINKRILKLREKIIFPLNLILLSVGLYFGFGNSDLGATTKSIDYKNAQGEQKTALITKEEFRTGFYIFNFEPKTKDSSYAWMDFGISKLLYQDLLQNKNLTPRIAYSTNTTDKVNGASLFNDYYIDGEFDVKDGKYYITTYIRDARNAEITKQRLFEGDNLLSLIDDITNFVTDNFTSSELNLPKYIDLDVEDFTSNSLKALEYFRNNDYENAIKEDSTFALAYLGYAKYRLTFNHSKFEERTLADNAYKYSYKLPLQKRGESLILKNLAYDEFDNAEALIKLQLEVDPSDKTYTRLLYNLYGRTKNIKDYTSLAYNNYKNAPTFVHGSDYIYAAIMNDEEEQVIDELNRLEFLMPNANLFVAKILPQLFKGDIKGAEKNLNKIDLLVPEKKHQTKIFKDAITYLKTNKVTKVDLKAFEGIYRSNYNEQTYEFWVENNTLLQYVSNQRVWPYLISGEDNLLSGTSDLQRIWKKAFFKNDSNNYYLIKIEQIDFSNSSTFYYWKIDNTISKAEALFEAKQLDSAKIAYEAAIKANPKHYYLKDALAHINYVTNTDSLTLDKQFKDVVGTYGPRTVWIENGKLLYKRGTRSRIELLPISENRYMNMINLDDNFAFEYNNGNVINCYNYHYKVEDEVWVKNDSLGRSLFLKD
ncbi:hypothetical protein [Psychroserpens sp.]|uniref:hypothetical protein n=1 Tax=Psychroserpens sp. TaxID=2020870 RepID=UPI003859129B